MTGIKSKPPGIGLESPGIGDKTPGVDFQSFVIKHESLGAGLESPGIRYEALEIRLQPLVIGVETLRIGLQSLVIKYILSGFDRRRKVFYGRLVSELTGQLHMVKTWNAVFATQGQAWGIPQNHITQLINDTQEAEIILDKVKSGERTAAEVVQCNMILKDMETEARFVKKHYLLMPPLTLADFPLLLLPLPDEIHTPVEPPTGQPSLTVTYPGGPHILMVHLTPLAGTEPPGQPGGGPYPNW